VPNLDNKVILVTGAASGIGRSAALCCARAGATIIALDLDTNGVASCVEELTAIGVTASGYTVDIQDEAEVTTFFTKITQSHDHIDGVIHAAGILEGALVPIEDFESLTWDRVIDINLKGSFLIARNAVPLLERASKGVLILISSGAGVKGGSSIHWTNSRSGTRVNLLSPGPIETPIYGKTGLSQEAVDGMGQKFAASVPLGRFGTPDEMANVALFLASDESSYITGADIQADGGLTQVYS